MTLLPCLRQINQGVEICVYVQPRASRNRIVALRGDELKIALMAPPVEGAANKACQDFFAKLFRTAKSQVYITSGETSRHKRLLIEGADLQKINVLLEQELRG